jgi:hypothetical protein
MYDLAIKGAFKKLSLCDRENIEVCIFHTGMFMITEKRDLFN